MATERRIHWAILVALNLACWYLLGVQQSPSQAQQSTNGELPFANSVAQRFETIDQLKQINSQLKEQNSLLRSGTLRVVVTLDAPTSVNPPKRQ